MALKSTLVFDWSAILQLARDLGSAEAPLAKRVALALASGTGANQADVIYADTLTIAISATVALDLVGGGLVDALGQAFAPAKLKALLAVASQGNTNAVQLVRPASNGVPIFLAAGDGIALLPGAVFAWASPNAVGVPIVAGTGDLLNLINGGGTTTVDVDLMLIGTSA